MITKATIQITIPVTLDLKENLKDEWAETLLKMSASSKLSSLTFKDMKIVECIERPSLVKEERVC